ncbi:10 TM acyl transferase domain found in Cas1p-domain-containing protein [Absidia repens]|uniref:10 TM acyl transferase domain found in Cas1p-domain-containing protein n=1 Tax=Absidia repens TaxID=90262 RepID=A0A1X2I0T2_9FUNG|nr:10 TM acyl transferase domain found in Cas1p-domain-containing protein [Absidia repens]
MSGTSVARAKVLQLGICITFCIMVFSTLARYILDANNRTRCESMLNEGDWLDDDTYKQWQPPGCMMHIYRPDDVASCLNHSRILYIGDSIARQQFFSFAKLINNGINTDGEKHIDRKFEFAKEGLTFEFWWDPYLNSTRTVQYLQQSGVGVDTGDRPSLLVVGTGSWHMRYLDSRMYMEDWQKGIDTVLDAIQRSPNVADAVILSPVEIPDFDHLSSDRALTITKEKVAAMNNYLASQQQAGALHAQTPFVIPFAWNKMIESSHNVTEDGLHYDTVITETQVQLALNYRCNDVRPKHFPYAATCCFHYPSPRWYQNIFFALFLIIVPVGLYFCDTDFSNIIPSEKVLNALFVFGLGVIYMYFGDRTQLFGKMHKNFDSSTFMTLMMLFVLLSGMITLKTAKKENVDLGFLNRDQTDEWKGWMQVIILIYHFMVLLTGYDDFGLARVLNVMVRLNLLTFVLQYLMDTDYLSYYFTPLVSFWFCVIYLTMYIGHTNNKNTVFMGAKIAIAALVTTLFFNIRWNAMEWRFRLSLDGFIVYVGMISAFVYIKCLEHKWMDHLLFGKVKLATLIGAGLAMVWYFWFELTRQDKFAYNQAQPYISWIPILAFVFLRNATVRLRNTSSRFFIFIGKISLETFIGQFHMWLAGDTKGVLLVIPNSTWVAQSTIGWWTNLMVSTVLFIFVSYYISKATGDLSQWICNDLLLGKQPQQQRAVTNPVPLLPTSTLASSTIPTSVQSSAQTSTSNESLHVQPDTGGRNKGMVGGSGIDSTSDPTKFVTMDEDEDEEHGVPMSKPHSLGYRIITDPRFKVITFLLGVGILNRLS